MQQRKIVHIDMDAFYASIEQRDHPELRGQPVLVGGRPEKRGVVATCSYEARRFGVHSAMPSKTALQLCPHAVFLSPRFEVYRAVSAQIMDCFRLYTDLVEPLSLDEAYLDVTENKLGLPSATKLARQLKQQILERTGLTASAGVSYNKLLAKLASDYHKPDGLTVIPPEQAAAFLDQLPIQKFFGVGKVTEAKLRRLGIQTGGDLKLLTEDQLRAQCGKFGSQLYRFVRGEDDRAVTPKRERKSVGKEITLAQDVEDRETMLQILEELAGQVEQRLQELGLQGKTVVLKIRWSDFQLFTRSLTTSQPLQEKQAIMQVIRSLVRQVEHRPVRLLGITISHLVSSAQRRQTEQFHTLSLW